MDKIELSGDLAEYLLGDKFDGTNNNVHFSARGSMEIFGQDEEGNARRDLVLHPGLPEHTLDAKYDSEDLKVFHKENKRLNWLFYLFISFVLLVVIFCLLVMGGLKYGF